MSDENTVQVVAEGIIRKRVDQFIQLRTRLREIDATHEEARKGLVHGINVIESFLMEHLDKIGANSIKTDAGTCYTSTRTTASLGDPAAFMNFVIANEEFDLLERRASSTAVQAYVKEHDGVLPPGVNLNMIRSLGVRKPPNKD